MPYNHPIPDAPIALSMLPRLEDLQDGDLIYVVRPTNPIGQRSKSMALGQFVQKFTKASSGWVSIENRSLAGGIEALAKLEVPKGYGGSAHFTDSTLSSDLGKEITVTANMNYDIYISNGEGFFYINNDGNKNNLQTLNVGDASSYIFKYEGGFLNEINPYNLNVGRVDFTGHTIDDVLCPDSPRYSNITIARTGIGGNTDKFVQCDTLSTFIAGGSALEGDIVNFDKFKGLTSLQIQNIAGETRSNCKISGTIESLLDSIYAKGRVSGTLQIVASGTDVTYNGSAASSTLTFTFTSGGWSLNT